MGKEEGNVERKKKKRRQSPLDHRHVRRSKLQLTPTLFLLLIDAVRWLEDHQQMYMLLQASNQEDPDSPIPQFDVFLRID